MVALITTIIPTYKRPQLLKRAIASACNQTVRDIRICVYDNASDDETAEVVLELAKTDPRIEYHCHPTTIRAQENFQYGLERVQTPFFSILSDDDILLPNAYETALAMLKTYPEAIFFLGSAIDVHENGQVISANALNWEDREFWTPPEGLYAVIDKYINWTGALFRKEALQRVQIDTSLKAIDFDFVTRLAAQAPYAFSKTPCAYFVHHNQSYSSQCGSKLVWPGYLKIADKLTQESDPETKLKIQQHMQAILKKQLFHIAIASIARHNFSNAKTALNVYQSAFPLEKMRTLLIKGLLRCENKRIVFYLFQRVFNSLLMLKRYPLQKYENNYFSRWTRNAAL